jgi:hypothetical protein
MDAAATETYKESVGVLLPGDAPHGPQFLSCLERQYRTEGDILAGRL